MTFLELCQKVRQNSGISGEGPTAVNGQIGILSKVVTWVTKAALDVQLERRGWFFLWATANGNTQIGMKTYLPGDLNITNVKDLDTVLIGTKKVSVKKWDWWLDNVRKAGIADRAGSPEFITISPDSKIHLYPVPNAVETITFDYYRKPVALVNNGDVCVVPVEYHQAIVEKALMYYAQYEDDTYRYQQSSIDYKQWINLLERDQLPELTFG
jgi:hypothetical protein